ncbi:MAG: PHP domain-containing protein [Acidithiobacillus sp.]|uniref:PHP domain-containing protein n=1 Tax=Acidithiobacillus sp. TaxID=1872118 RepID=UPI0025C14588|nr:PHP domain-containing protein [Acidithiobacillus sp.]
MQLTHTTDSSPRSRVDLHMHSTFSDGSLPVDELVARVAAAGVEVMALTDHDNTAGVALAAKEAQRHGLRLIPGVEISSVWEEQGIHIVGLAMDIEHPALQRGLERIVQLRDQRALEIAERLQQQGIAGAWDGARAIAGSPLVGRAHFAQWLVQAGHCKDSQDAFQRYLGRGKPAYVPSDWIPMAEAVGWIRAAGGEAVLAHPGRYKLSGARLKRLLEDFRAVGGAGLEVCSGSQAAADREHLGRLAIRLGMAGSVGSDFHGPKLGHAEIGQLLPLPDGVETIWDRLGVPVAVPFPTH